MLSSARIAPSWIRTAKVLPKSSSPKPKKCCSRSRCPVDDTGMYSVRPSTMPRPAALKISTNMDRNSCKPPRSQDERGSREAPKPQCLWPNPTGRAREPDYFGSARPPANTSTLDWFAVDIPLRLIQGSSPCLPSREGRQGALPGFERIVDFYRLPFEGICSAAD